jgi:hypothetical protein
MCLSSRISMNLARKMIKSINLPYILQDLFLRLITPGNNLNIPRDVKLDETMQKILAKWVLSHRFREWQRMMGNHRQNLPLFLPRLMLLGRNKRACSVHSLTGMTLFRHVDFFPRNLKLLRAMFSVCFESGKSFSLEFSAHDNRILVLKFTPRNGAIFMSTELYDRFSGIIRKTEELEVRLVHDRHLIDLNVQISKYKTGLATFFYVRSILLPFPVDYDIGDFNIERYSLVSFWLGDEIPDFDKRCDERLNQKRIRDCEPSSEVPSEADSKRRRIAEVDVSLKRIRDCEPSSGVPSEVPSGVPSEAGSKRKK